MGPYAFRRNQWVGFDDEAIVRKKAAYAVEHGLGGIMFWAIDNDDFRGTCTGKPYPLIEAAKDEMLSLLGLGINEVSKPGPPKKPVRSRSRDNTSSSRNRISGVTDEKPTSLRNSLSRTRKTSTTTSTTIAPSSTTIKLTEVEGSSLYIGGRTTTPAPPTTPDPGADFKCEEEGFFQHPRDCKKYYWCLDSGPSGLGIVAHQFVCPSGLYFNPAADSCDFARNVPCKTKKSTTPAPTSSPPPTTTTRTTTVIPRSTESPVAYKNSFYRSSTTPKITTSKPTRSTTTTSTANYETDYEYEDKDDEIDTISRDAEEDPKVLKELIQLIRKVGGIDELEKHLLRKEDGTISFKQADVASNNPTTPATISKSLYDKVLSRPNTFNTFRNRFTSSSLFRKKAQDKEISNEEKSQDETLLEQVNPTEQSGSKYSSVLRNARPRPQNDGLDKLPEFDAFLKEKKQYVNIARNRPKTINDENLAAEKHDDEDEDEYEDEDEVADEEEKQIVVKTTQRSVASVRPSYASIRRTRPTVPSETEEEAPALKVTQTPNRETEKSYPSLNRRRGTTTTTTTTEKSRYNTVERVRFSPSTTTTLATTTSLDNLDVEDEETDASDEQHQENVRKQANVNVVAATQKTQIYTTRNYANIGSRFKNTASNTTNHLETAADISNTINDNNSILERMPNQTLTPTTNIPSVTNSTTISTNYPDTTDNYESENATFLSTPINLHSSTVNDEDITTTTPTSSSTIQPTTNNYLTTVQTDELMDEVTKKSEYQVSLDTETTTQKTKPTSTITITEIPKITNDIQNSNTKLRKIQPQQTTSTTDTILSNQILGTVSSPRPFGFPKRRLPSSTFTPIIEDSLSANKFKENANVVKTVTAVNSNAPKVSSNANVLSSTILGQEKREHIHPSTQKYQIRTFTQMHLVESSLTTPLPRSFNVVDNNDENTVTKRTYSWRDVRRPSKAVEINQVEKSFRQNKSDITSSHIKNEKRNNNIDSILNPLGVNEMLVLEEVAPADVGNSTIQQPFPHEKSRSTLQRKTTNKKNWREVETPNQDLTQNITRFRNITTTKTIVSAKNHSSPNNDNFPNLEMENKNETNMNHLLVDSLTNEQSNKNTFTRKQIRTKLESSKTGNEQFLKGNFVETNHINPRKARQDRGSVKYAHSDLSSLLSLDFAPKSERRTTIAKTNSSKRKFIQNNSTQNEDTENDPPRRTRPLQRTTKEPIRDQSYKKEKSTRIIEESSIRANIEPDIENGTNKSQNESNSNQNATKTQFEVKQVTKINMGDSSIIFVEPPIVPSEKNAEKEKKLSEVKPTVNTFSKRPLSDHRRLQQSTEAPISSSHESLNKIKSNEKLQFNKTVRVGKTLNSQNSQIFTIDRRNIQLNPRQLNGIPFATTPILKLRVLEDNKATKPNEGKRSRYLTNNSKALKNNLLDSTPAEDSLITTHYIPSNVKTIQPENLTTNESEVEETTIGTTIELESLEEVETNPMELQTETPLSIIPTTQETTESLEDFTTDEIYTTFMPVLSVEAENLEKPKEINSEENSIKEPKQESYEGHVKHSVYEDKNKTSEPPKSEIEHIAKSIYKRPLVSRQKQEEKNLIEGDDSDIADKLVKVSSSTSRNNIERIQNPIYRRPYGFRNSIKAENNENTQETTTIQSEIQGFRKSIYRHPFASRKSSEIKNIQIENSDSKTTEPMENVFSSTIKIEIDPIRKPLYNRPSVSQKDREAEISDKQVEDSELNDNLEEVLNSNNQRTETNENTTNPTEIEHEDTKTTTEENTNATNPETITIRNEIEQSLSRPAEESTKAPNSGLEVSSHIIKNAVKQDNNLVQTSRNEGFETVNQIHEGAKNTENNTEDSISQTEVEAKSKVQKLIYKPEEATETANLEKNRKVPDSTERNQSEIVDIKHIRKPLFRRPFVKNIENESQDSKSRDESKILSSSTISSIRKPYKRITTESPEIGNVIEEDIQSPKKIDDQKVVNFKRPYLNLNRKQILENKNPSSDLDPKVESEPIINKLSSGRTYTKRPILKSSGEDDENAKEIVTRPPYTSLRRFTTTRKPTVRATSKAFTNAIEANKLQQRNNLFSKRISSNEKNLEESEEYYDYDEYVDDEYEDVDEELVEEQDATDSSRTKAGVGSKSFIVNNTTNYVTRVNETQAQKYETVKNVIKEEDNVNSKRRLQKNQLSPFRSQEESVSDINQVNRTVSDDARAEDDEHSTNIKNNTTAIPRRKIVLKYRRPLVQLNENNINILNNLNTSAVNDSNYNNTATNYTIENQTQINNIATTKRPRKIIRKFIKPLNQTNTNLSESNRTVAIQNENLKAEPVKENVLETSTSVTPPARKKLITKRPFTTTASTTKLSTLKYTRRKYVEYTTAAPLEPDVEEDDEEYEDYEDDKPEPEVYKSTTATPKIRPLYKLQNKNILKTSTTTEVSVDAEEADYEEAQLNEEIPSTTFRNSLIKSGRPAFVPKNREPTNTNRLVGNRKFERPSIINKPRSFERKFTTSTTETPALLEDLDIEALNARNKKIFDSKKYTSIKNKSQTQPLQEQQQNHTENMNEIENTTLISIIYNSTTTTTISNEIPIVTETNDNEFSSQGDDVVNTTPQTPSTTLIHIFTLFDEMSTTAKPATNGKARLLSEQPKHKVVEINRIVEVTAKEDKLRRKSKKHPDVLEPIGTSSLKVVSLPHLEQLGEISVVKFVHLVDGSDIEIDGHSTVADYTPTEPNIARNSAPVRNSLPNPYPTYVPAYDVLTKRYGKALIPEVIRESVETSTIPLEGLFDHMRQAKQLNGYDDEFGVTEQPVETTSSTTTTARTTVMPTTQYPKYVRPIVPLLRPESNESAPIVISLSNLDQVILSKVGKPSIVKPDKNTQNSTT